MKKFRLFSLASLREHDVNAAQVDEFYHDQILGRQKRLLDRAVQAGQHFACGFGLVGTVMLKLFTPEGGLTQVSMGANLVVTTGKNAVIDRLQAASPAVHDYQAIGTGNTAAAAGDTALQTEVGTRVQGTLSQPAATTDRLVSTFAAGNGTAALTETGRLNAASTGNLFARQVFATINKGAGDSLQVTHDITIS